MKDEIQKLIDNVKTNLKLLEDDNLKPWDPSKKNNDKNFTPLIIPK